MMKEIIKYKLAKNISEKHLLSVCKEVQENWMNEQTGFIGWEINKDEEGNYIDIVYWESEKDSKKAEAQMRSNPKAKEWFECYEKDSITSTKLNLIKEF